MYILLFLLLFVIAIAIMGLSLLSSLLRLLFGGFRRPTTHQTEYRTQEKRQTYTDEEEERTGARQSAKKQGKFFEKDEGEYVDFEEIKE